MPVNLDPELLSILVCPRCRSELAVDDQAAELACTSSECALAYPVRDGIPVLLIDEARDPRSAGLPAVGSANPATGPERR